MSDRQQVTLGQLIEQLRGRDPDEDVRFDFCGFIPADVDSYRGIYAQLAIGYRAEGAPCTVRDLLSTLRKAVGATFEGYKGGSYTMDANTPLWAANYGRSSSTAIVGLAGCEYSAVIETRFVP